jgi:hypothetical protein
MAESKTVESKYKNVVDSLLKAIDDAWTTSLKKTNLGESLEIKLPIKKIDEVTVFVFFKIQHIVDGIYIRINIVSNNIVMKESFYTRRFKHGNSSENELYSFFNDLENLKLDYYGMLSTKNNFFVNVLNSFNGLAIDGIVFDDIDDKKCCVCTNLTLTSTCCNHRYCFRCRSKNIEITKKDICPICRCNLNYTNLNGANFTNCNDDDEDEDDEDYEDEDDDEDYEDEDDEVCSGCDCVHCACTHCGFIHCNDEEEDDREDDNEVDDNNDENDVNQENENKDN